MEQVKELRRESLEAIKAMPERAWDSFFFNQDKNNTIKFFSKSYDNIEKNIEILAVNSITPEIIEESEQAKSLINLISKKQSRISILQIQVILNPKEGFNYLIVAGTEGTLALDIPDEDDSSF
ncbi:hypothetical protein [Gloeothece verrucosa]|uniref:hypothetical protein n=1 Tax=Gloeothece verrucosa TaxID=2546359 RepID=UPI00017E1F20|nr:hypothetical protein [Gloeothece verrucosa]